MMCKIADSAKFEVLDQEMAVDLEKCLIEAIHWGAVFDTPGTPLQIFRSAIAAAITDIEERGNLLQRFLKTGPYKGGDKVPSENIGSQCLSDEETARAIAFIHSHMVNCFKGRLAELFAIRPCIKLIDTLRINGRLSPSSQLFIGDIVMVERLRCPGLAKGADFHVIDGAGNNDEKLSLALVGEVKSYPESKKNLSLQLEKHVNRAGRGIQLSGRRFKPSDIRLGTQLNREVIKLSFVPASWKLSRKFYLDDRGGKCVIVPLPQERVRQSSPPSPIASNEWRVLLQWSQEALASAAYEMTFWYMEKLGQTLFALDNPWPNMSAAKAGRNAAKEMLYYAMLRCRTHKEKERSIAIYNTYCFGYAIGMNFRNNSGQREMLWPEDLDQMASGNISSNT